MVTPFSHPQGEGLMPLQPVYTGAPHVTKTICVCIKSGSQDEISHASDLLRTCPQGRPVQGWEEQDKQREEAKDTCT